MTVRTVTVVPEEFSLVHYDAGRIAAIASKVADDVGLPPHVAVRVEVDERTPLGRTRLLSLDPVTVSAESGAFEDPLRLRHLSERGAADVLGRLFLRARDRLDPAFGEPPAEDELTLEEQTAWDAYALGRLERRGHAPHRARRLYHFRNRHGFSDVADAVFDRLWAAEDLTWSDLRAACAETAAVRAATATPA